MDENEIYEALGVEPPQEPTEPTGGEPGTEPSGEPVQEPAAHNEPSGGQEPPREPAEPSGGEPAPEPASPEGQPGGQEPPAPPIPQPKAAPPVPQPQPQALPGVTPPRAGVPAPPEVRGKLDPYTNRAIQTQADYDAYLLAFRQEQAQLAQQERQQALEKVGLDQNVFNAMVQEAIAKDPMVQEARQAAQLAQAREAQAQRQAAMDWYGKQIQEINALDAGADIKDIDDLAKRDPQAFRVMLGAVQGGMSLVQAYQAIHASRLIQAAAQAAEQRARNQAGSKSHLTPLGGKGGAAEDVSVPADVAETYRELNPGITEAEIRKMYADYLKETGGK